MSRDLTEAERAAFREFAQVMTGDVRKGVSVDDQVEMARTGLARLRVPVRRDINEALLLSVKRLRQQGHSFLDIGSRHGLTYHQVREIARVMRHAGGDV